MTRRLAFVFALVLSAVALPAGPAVAQQQVQMRTLQQRANADIVINGYATLVLLNYKDCLKTARLMDMAIDRLLANPSPKTLANAREAWKAARIPYGQSEVFRFYEGPIDFANLQTNEQGPEARLNAWPVNEAHIDYVKGDRNAGIINNQTVKLTRENILERNQTHDEADVTTGYHAIEFLLWGQDFSATGPGDRPHTDFEAGEPSNDRRREYLKLVTQILIDDLEGLVAAWGPDDKDNYRAEFEANPPKQTIGHMLTGMATLAGFELASERIAVSLDSGDQEDEHSCFSDTTHIDIAMNLKGISNVWNGRYGSFQAPGVEVLARRANRQLAEKISGDLLLAQGLVEQIEPPVDAILASEEGSEQRQVMEQLVAVLQGLARNLVQVGEDLGVEVVIAAE